MWLFLSLLTALFTSLIDLFSRKLVHKIDVHVIAWGWAFFSLPFLYLFLFFPHPPVRLGPDFLWALCATTSILTVATVLYFNAIKASDLSVTVPMLAFTPVFMLITSPLMIGQAPRPLGLIGILLIGAGSYILNFKTRRKGYLEPFKNLWKMPGPRFMLVVALLYSIGANIDRIGLTNSSPLIWPAAINTALAATLGALMLKRTSNIVRQIKDGWVFLLLMGTSAAFAFFFQMIAIGLTLVPYVIAVKRTSVMMTAMFGFVIFKEGGVRERFTGVVLMILGVILIYVFQ